MKEYCLNYKILVGINWIQMCSTVRATDDQQAVKIARCLLEGCKVKDEALWDRKIFGGNQK